MKILPLIIAPDSLLKKPSIAVDKIDDELRDFMKNMLNTMYHEGGIGLASVQVGVLKRIIVMDIDYKIDHHHHHSDHSNCGALNIKNANPQYFINPEIIETSKDQSNFNEGCLSFPDIRFEIERPSSITIKYLDFNGDQQITSFDGISATCIQHEIDHINGITFVDKVSSLKRQMALNKLKKRK